MQTNSYERVHPLAKKLWVINGLIFSLLIIIVVIAVTLLLYKSIWIIVGGLLLCVYCIVIAPEYEYRQWKYFVNGEKVEIIHGIFIVKRTIIPINRIQHINIKQGPIQKKFDLSNVELFTAGGQHAIEGLKSEVAASIADQLNDLVIKENLNEE